MDLGKLPVSIFEFESDRAHRPRRTASDLGLGELEAIGLHDADAVLGASNRIEDRRALRFNHAVDLGLGGAAVDIDLDIDIGDDRLMHLVAGRDEDVEYRGSGLGVLASQDAEQGSPLLGCRAAVEHLLALAFALINGAGQRKIPAALSPSSRVDPWKPLSMWYTPKP